MHNKVTNNEFDALVSAIEGTPEGSSEGASKSECTSRTINRGFKHALNDLCKDAQEATLKLEVSKI